MVIPAEILNNLKIELDISGEDTTQDDKLNRLISKAVGRVMAFTNQDETYVTTTLSDYVIDFTVLMYNRLGTEGSNSQSNSGQSDSYLNDLPQDLKQFLYSHRKLAV